MRTAILTGMFDPFTRGHEDIARRASALFERTVVLISRNAEKKGLLPLDVRTQAIRACFPNGEIEVCVLDGLLADFVKRYENPVLVRGARNGTDFDYEAQLRAINLALGGLDTLILPSDGSLSHISSSFARELIRYQKPLENAIPRPAANVIEGYLHENHLYS